MSQGLIYVVGPSGAGKDSVLNWLMQHLPENLPVHWARRTITRPCTSGSEMHETMTESDFNRVLADGGFAMSWQANRLHYGIRHRELQSLSSGRWVVVNGSRAYLAQAQLRWQGMQVVHITAHTDTLAQRLVSRQRETSEEIAQRIARAQAFDAPVDAIEIHNNGTLEQAGLQLLTALQKLLNKPA